MFFAHSSPTWGGGGVAFVDVDAPSPANLGTTFRLYRVTLQQYNDVLAQENGMLPGDPACRELTPEEAAELARAWTNLLEDDARDGGNGADPVPASVHAGTLPARGSSTNPNQDRTPPAEMRAPSERWYGYVKCIGTHEGEPVLTFTCDAEELGRFGMVPSGRTRRASRTGTSSRKGWRRRACRLKRRRGTWTGASGNP